MRRRLAIRIQGAMLALACTCVVRVAAPDVAGVMARSAARGRIVPDARHAPRPEPVDAAPPSEPRAIAWAQSLGAVTVKHPNTDASAKIRLYKDSGALDDGALAAFDQLVGENGRPAPMNRRVVQLAFKAAYHFHARTMTIVSAYRSPQSRARGKNEGPHGRGVAIDFKLAGVDSRQLASYLRALPRVGVGIYTHPTTQYVHLDVRETSWHWIDGSPSGKTWRETPLPDARRVQRDAIYEQRMDLPD
jgi:uncharacterized protein YcbK (DUF882 family)